MANFAKIEVLLTSNPTTSSSNIQIGLNYNSVDYTLIELPVSIRGAGSQFTVGASLEDSAINLNDALFLDYRPGGLVESLPLSFYLNPAGDTVIIEANQYGVTFSEISIPSWATTDITPEVLPPAEFGIESISTQEASADQCNKARYNVTLENYDLSDFPVELLIDSSTIKICATEADLFFDYDRFPVPVKTLQAVSDNGPSGTLSMPRVSTYSFASENIEVTEAFSGATVVLTPVIDNIGDVSLTFTYSLDDISYQSSNIFYSLTPGNYTGYVLDNYGCKQSATFEVIGVTIDKPGPIFIIENANPIKFYQSTVFSLCGERPNYDNSKLSDQGYHNIEKKNYNQIVQQCDNTTIQIKSNYETIIANVLDCDDNIVQSPTVTLEREYILQKDKRDCQLKAGAEGKINIYYISGNTYDPGTLDIIGTYSLSNGLLPSFASDGNISSGITIDLSSTTVNGTFIVESAVYDEEIQGYALQINGTFTGVTGEAGITDSVYNEEDYNVHEFVIDWASISEGIYRVEINGTDADPRYDEVNWPSEYIHNKLEHKKSVLIKYSNPDNIEQIDYSTGVEFTMRVDGRFIRWRNGGESENFISDDGTKKQLKGQVIREVQLECNQIPQYIVEKLSIASIHKELYINGIKATLSEQGESEDRFDERNPFYNYSAWYQLGEPITISDASGIVSGTGRILEVNANGLLISV